MLSQESSDRTGVATTGSGVRDRGPASDDAYAADHFVSGLRPLPSPIPELVPGTKLGRFVIVRRLGTGRATAVYLARDEVRAQEIALKVVATGACKRSAAETRLRNEHALHESITDHRHVVRVFDLHSLRFEGLDLLAMSMEYADGGTLRSWLEEHRDDLDVRRKEGFGYFKEALRGVAGLHAAGITHLDLKPENLLFVNGVLKIIDFGVSFRMGEVGDLRPWMQFDPCPGTPLFAAPESWLAARPWELTPRADVYSLGVLLFEICEPEGRPPFVGSDERLRELHAHAAPPSNPGASQREQQVIARCMEKDPANRFADGGALLEALEHGENTERDSSETAKASKFWSRVNAHLHNDECEKACALLKQLIEECPNEARAKVILSDLQKRFDQAGQMYHELANADGALPLSTAVDLLRRAVGLYPNHPAGGGVQLVLAMKARRFRQHMQAGWQAACNGFWDAAITQFQQANTLDSVGQAACQAIDFLSGVRGRVLDLRQRTDEALRQGNGRLALSLARALDELCEDVRDSFRRRLDGNVDESNGSANSNS